MDFNSRITHQQKELFEADFRNEIPKPEIEDSNLSAFCPIQHFNDMQRNPKRAKKKDLSFAISATSLQQEQRLKRQQEVLKVSLYCTVCFQGVDIVNMVYCHRL